MEIEVESVINRLRDLKDHFLDQMAMARARADSLPEENPEKDVNLARVQRALGAAEGVTVAISSFEALIPRPRPFGGRAA